MKIVYKKMYIYQWKEEWLIKVKRAILFFSKRRDFLMIQEVLTIYLKESPFSSLKKASYVEKIAKFKIIDIKVIKMA